MNIKCLYVFFRLIRSLARRTEQDIVVFEVYVTLLISKELLKMILIDHNKHNKKKASVSPEST